jgi:16S rRNA (adenine1518-N6/adenine1519-N6)-dimethyltransferase
LLAAGANVVAIEKDPLFAIHLQRLQTSDGRLQVHTADFLTFPLKTFGSAWKVVSNIPFKITAPILEMLCNHSDQFTSFTLIVQKEVANRIKAQPKTKEFGSLTVFLQFYTTCNSTFPISPTSFYPRPAVGATITHLTCHDPPPGIDPERFFSFVKKAFQQRRKMLTSSLRDLHLKNHLEELGISLKARPEELNFREWLELFKKCFSTSS